VRVSFLNAAQFSSSIVNAESLPSIHTAFYPLYLDTYFSARLNHRDHFMVHRFLVTLVERNIRQPGYCLTIYVCLVEAILSFCTTGTTLGRSGLVQLKSLF